MPGPSCKYKDGSAYKDGTGAWRVPCSCGAVSPPFKVKALAHQWFRRHKNDDELALSVPLQRAIITLSDHGLLQGDYDRLRKSLQPGGTS